MKRRASLFGLVVCGVLAIGCNKPAEEDCKKAVENMRKLLGTGDVNADLAPHIRRCRGGSTKEAVACAIKASSKAELEACKFARFDDTPPKSSEDGSGSAK